VQTRASGRVVNGEGVSVSVRPESLSVSAEETGAANEFPASVLGATYFGNHEEYELALRDDVSVRAMIHNPGHVEYRPGDRVHVSFNPADAIPLSDGSPVPSDPDDEVV
jgi:ABC-type Fe3+/spermidine/putrescine transport system ATPase subunit